MKSKPDKMMRIDAFTGEVFRLEARRISTDKTITRTKMLRLLAEKLNHEHNFNVKA